MQDASREEIRFRGEVSQAELIASFLTMTFELEPHAKGTILVFHHEGWKAYSNEFASCSYDWALFFRSLKFLCEKGKGFPYPDFNK
jgi:hypothetical protein